jgi:hypothetical protein
MNIHAFLFKKHITFLETIKNERQIFSTSYSSHIVLQSGKDISLPVNGGNTYTAKKHIKKRTRLPISSGQLGD